MKTKTWKLLLLLFAAAPLFTACDDDEDYYYVHNGDMWSTYGNLEKIDNGSCQKYAIRMDDGDRLIVTDGMFFSADEGDEGMRVHVRYAYVGSERGEAGLNGTMDYYIRLYGINEVLCKEPVKQSFINENEEHRQDSIGNDPINVTDAWLGGKYLNVEFQVLVKNNSDVKHFINLVQEDVETHNDTVYVYLRHNAYEDGIDLAGTNQIERDYRWNFGRVSFDLTPILGENQTSTPIKFIWTAFNREITSTVQCSETGTFTLSNDLEAETGLYRHSAVQEVSSEELSDIELN